MTDMSQIQTYAALKSTMAQCIFSLYCSIGARNWSFIDPSDDVTCGFSLKHKIRRVMKQCHRINALDSSK